MSSVKIESRTGLGNVLVAARAFHPAEAVVHERPLLHVPQLKPSNPLYKPLQAYFEEHHIPPSVILKIMAFVMASPSTQASVLRCFCPDMTAYADAAVVQQAQAFATCLLQHPPVPEFAQWAESLHSPPSGAQLPHTARHPSSESAAAAAAAADAEAPSHSGVSTQQRQQQLMRQQNPGAFDVLVRVWLIWIMNGHNFKLGSALFDYGSKLTHTCAGPNTMYRTAAGDVAAVVESVEGGSSSAGGSSTLRQAPPSAGAGVGGSAAGLHVALLPIAAGELLTTNYLGMSHKRLMSTPARQKYLQDKFLFKCTCNRCMLEVDAARGIPCPQCSGPFRSEDKLLQEHVALADWQLGQDLTDTPTTRCTGDSTHNAAIGTSATAVSGAASAVPGSGSGTGSGGCGYVYCDMAALLSGASTPWKCGTCGAAVADDTGELWGRHYTKSHATIESEMEGWVNRLDESLDTAPLVRDPSVLHQRVLGVLRLLGPCHWASWRLLLLGVELHCGALEEAMLKVQLRQKAKQRAQQAAQATPAADVAPSGTPAATTPTAPAQQPTTGDPPTAGVGPPSAAPAGSEDVHDPAAAAYMTQLGVWVVRYCRQLWRSVSAQLGVVEAGQVLGHHFTEASQVLLQVASSPGMLPPAAATSLVDAALQLQLLVLPGLRSIMGADFNPLAQLLGAGSPGMGGAEGSGEGSDGQGGSVVDAAAVAAAVRRQMQQRAAEASQMVSLVQELKQLEAKERV